MEEFENLSDIGIIIPVYKSQEKLKLVLEKILNLNPEIVIIVDDKCPENSTDNIFFDSKKIIKLKHSENKGVGAAFMTGIEYIKDKNLDKVKFICKIDSDDQHDPNDLIIMKKSILKYDVDFIKGNRFLLMRRPKNMSLIRKIGNIGLTFLFKLATGYWNISDPVNGIFLGRSRVLFETKKFNVEKRYLFESSLLFCLSKLKAKILEVPSNISYSDEISSLKWHRELFPFFLFYLKGFFSRIFREYLYPDLNPGVLPLLSFFVFFVLLIKKIIILSGNINKSISSEISDINLFVVYLLVTLFSFFIWLLFDTTKNNQNISIYNFLK